jgi:preprotein translocase subunit SecG
MSILIGFLTAIHVIVALILIGLVLMQKSSEQGIGAAFGGGVTETVFGGGTTTALVRMTIWCAGILLATTLILAVLHSHRSGGGESLMQKTMQAAPAQAPATSEPLQLPSTPNTAPIPSTPPEASPPVEAPSAPAPSQPEPAKTP